MILLCLLTYGFLTIIQGFLLDEAQTFANKSAIEGQFLTISEFKNVRKIQQQETDVLRQETDLLRQKTSQLRHDVDKTFVQLTSQLQQKLNEIEQKLGNETKHKCNCSELNQKYDDLETKYNMLVKELNEKESKHESSFQYARLEHKLNELKLYNVITQQKYNSTKQEVESIKNDAKNMANLISFLFQVIQGVTNMTNSTKEQLLNLKTNTDSLIYELKQNQTLELTSIEKETDDRFQEFEKNMSIANDRMKQAMHSDIQNQITSVLSAQNKTFDKFEHTLETVVENASMTYLSLLHQINEANDKVLMTSYCTSSGTVNGIIKFNNVKYAVGMSNLTTYRNTGKFICENPGLYLISVSIASYSHDARYYIVLNGNKISHTYIGLHENNWEHTGTVVLTLPLRVHDALWIQAERSLYVWGGLYSQLTIIKVK